MRQRSLFFVLLLLATYASAMFITNSRLTILDDEAIIAAVAANPVHTTLQAFIHGHGRHEHPPLSDLFLHGWLLATRYSLAWLRVSATLFYIAGLLFLAGCGAQMGTPRTAWAVILLGTLWPFGYFYARIAGWYCFCFFLVCALLYFYIRLSKHPTGPAWLGFQAFTVALVWSNYFSVAILALLVVENLAHDRRFKRKQFLLLVISISIAALSALPLWSAGVSDAHGTIHLAAALTPALAVRTFYCLFALLASVSVAPWFLPWSVPIAAAGLLLFYLLLAERASRRFVLFFMCLILGLALANHLDLKRLLFLTPWLLLALAKLCSCDNRGHSLAATACLAVIFLVGWIGIASGRHPATRNFYEPWRQVAQTTAAQARQGALIVSDSTLYFFYLDYALGLQGTPTEGTYMGQAVYRRAGVAVEDVDTLNDSEPKGRVVLVEGVASRPVLQAMASTRERLERTCRLERSWESTPDPSFAYKRLLGPSVPIVQYRVVVEDFLCDH